MGAVHARDPGCTRRALERAGTYERVVAAVPPGARVLDVGCGDGALLDRLPDAIGIDVSNAELRRARGAVAPARGQALPFRDAAFDAVTAHLVLSLVGDLDPALAEIARVLRRGGRLVALLGGGPAATPDGNDAFERFASLVGPRARGRMPRLADPRVRSTAGIAGALGTWFDDVTQTDHHVDLGGDFDTVWATLAALGYELAAIDDVDAVRRALRDGFDGRCTMHVRLVTAIRR